MRVVVTGAAGFIGYHVAERLSSLGHAVTAIDCFTDYYDRRLKEMNAADLAALGVKVLHHDLAEGADGILADAQVICHLAAQPGNSAATSLDKYVRNNIWATHHLAEAARKLPNFKLFVNCSTSSVYGFNATESEESAPQPVSHYGVTKLAAEQLVLALHRDKQFPACSLRLFSVYGPRSAPTSSIRCSSNASPRTKPCRCSKAAKNIREASPTSPTSWTASSPPWTARSLPRPDHQPRQRIRNHHRPRHRNR